MGKDIEKKLEKLIDLLKNLLSKREEALQAKENLQGSKPKVAGGYKARPRIYQHYPTYRDLIYKT